MANQPLVLITGALTGIGRATAIAFAREKASVVVSGRRMEEGQQLAEELRSLGAQAEFLQSDVRFEDDVRKLIDGVVARFGEPPPDDFDDQPIDAGRRPDSKRVTFPGMGS
ncbi:SDR family NAD(P)-dependent oxidoreductase [Paraburkholderia sp. SIMBA_030]|uniref:SDR family NAD(P)-dependent oxidoreductase n=1 Tax=Paraburkholderia sp. SIMBA_030 TaxID=3085773 RepID=UPI00397975D1